MERFLGVWGVGLLLLGAVDAQVIEFESNGLKYQTLTKSGVTVMCAQLQSHVRDFSIVQVAVANGSSGPYAIRPEDFRFLRADGTVIQATSSRDVISLLYQKSSGSDVTKLITSYEASVYGIPNMRSTNGYEQRRLAALAMGGARVRAAAAASALALVQTKLGPGESTDGAVFFATEGKPLGPGRLVVRTNTDTFDFKP
jgi:hypothetical protein